MNPDKPWKTWAEKLEAIGTTLLEQATDRSGADRIDRLDAFGRVLGLLERLHAGPPAPRG